MCRNREGEGMKRFVRLRKVIELAIISLLAIWLPTILLKPELDYAIVATGIVLTMTFLLVIMSEEKE